jgi:FkbM family methyltransferase
MKNLKNSTKIFIKRIISQWLPNIATKIRRNKIKKILRSPPQLSKTGIKYWGIQKYDLYEPEIQSIIEKLIINYDIFVNVGANHGIYCIKHAKQVDLVFAFEALAENVNILAKNIRENGLDDKIYLYPVAVGYRQSIETFYGASTGGSLLQGWNQQYDDGINIPMFTLDFLIYEKIKEKKILFLIDVEGSEYGVIKGSLKIIKNIDNAAFIMEIPCSGFMPNDVFNPNFMEIFKLFFNEGFQAWQISMSGDLLPLSMRILKEYVAENRYEGVMVVFSRYGYQ